MRYSNRPLYIFDLDGTLALVEHRRHLVEKPACPNCLGEDAFHPLISNGCTVCDGTGLDESFKPNWPEFSRQCIHDKPNENVIATFNALHSVGAELRVWSGRENSVRLQTIGWLQSNVNTLIKVPDWDELLTMRPTGDYTPDEVLKRSWLHALTPQERKRLVGVFDDRNKVCAMWREEGVTCFQVAEGNF